MGGGQINSRAENERKGIVNKSLHTWELCKQAAAAVVVVEKKTLPVEEEGEAVEGT